MRACGDDGPATLDRIEVARLSTCGLNGGKPTACEGTGGQSRVSGGLEQVVSKTVREMSTAMKLPENRNSCESSVEEILHLMYF